MDGKINDYNSKMKVTNNKLILDDIKLIWIKYDEFIPRQNMTIEEQLNSIFRLLIYISIPIIIFCKKFVVLPIFLMIILIIIMWAHKSSNNKQEFTKPTDDNPAMNYIYGDEPDKKEACKTVECEEERKEKIKNNMYINENDLFATKNQERIFFTQPVTTAVSDLNKYLKFVYDFNKTCKIDGYNCLETEKMKNNIMI